MKTPLLLLISYCSYYNVYSQDGWQSIPFEKIDSQRYNYYDYYLYNPEIKPTDERYFICDPVPYSSFQNTSCYSTSPKNGSISGQEVIWKFIKYNPGNNKLWMAGWTNYVKYVVPDSDSASTHKRINDSTIVTLPLVSFYTEKVFLQGQIYSYKQVYYNGEIQNPCISNNWPEQQALSVWKNVPKPKPPTITITRIPKSNPGNLGTTSFPYFTDRTPLGTIDPTDGYFEVQFYPAAGLQLSIGKARFDLGKISFKDLKPKEIVLEPKGAVLDLDSTLYNDSLKGWLLPDTLTSMQMYKWVHKFSNLGDDTLKIGVINAHACIANSPSLKPILPGESGEIRYFCECEVSNPHLRGYQVTINYNDKNATIRYFIYFK